MMSDDFRTPNETPEENRPEQSRPEPQTPVTGDNQHHLAVARYFLMLLLGSLALLLAIYAIYYVTR